MAGAYLVIGVLVLVILLLLFAVLAPKAKQYHFRSPIQKIQPKKKRKVAPKKKKLPLVQITFNKR